MLQYVICYETNPDVQHAANNNLDYVGFLS